MCQSLSNVWINIAYIFGEIGAFVGVSFCVRGAFVRGGHLSDGLSRGLLAEEAFVGHSVIYVVCSYILIFYNNAYFQIVILTLSILRHFNHFGTELIYRAPSTECAVS